MIGSILPWVADGLALLGLIVLTVSVYGLVRFPNVTIRIHAAGTAGVMGVSPILLAIMLADGATTAPMAFLVGSFLVLTSPVAAHEIGRAVHSVEENDVMPR
jgi:multicomponent Na+:H+ antiporter subunit G